MQCRISPGLVLAVGKQLVSFILSQSTPAAAGYMLTQIPGGYVTSRVGGRRVLPFGVGLWSAATAAVPFLAGTMPGAPRPASRKLSMPQPRQSDPWEVARLQLAQDRQTLLVLCRLPAAVVAD